MQRRCGGNNLSNVTSFIILRSGEGLTSSNKDNSANLSGKKNQMKHSRVSIFRIGEKFKSNLALVVLLVSNLKVSIVKCHVT